LIFGGHLSEGILEDMKHKTIESLTTISFYAPSLALYLLFFFVPAVLGFMYSFTSWNGISLNVHFIGLQNYAVLFGDARFFDSAVHTFLITIIQYVFFSFVSLIFAAIIEKIDRKVLRTQLRFLFFFPYIIGYVIVASVWRYMLDYRSGAINDLIRMVGLHQLAVDWLGNQHIINITIAMINIWAYSGFYLVIYMSAIKAIDPSMYESAHMDGAGPVREFLHITLPLVVPAITISSILSLAWGLSTFDAPLILTNGGPGFASETISYYVYWSGFLGSRQGFGTAISFLLFAVTLVLSVCQGILLRRKEVQF
jgi:ABC-type sugar transport system permease subunit